MAKKKTQLRVTEIRYEKLNPLRPYENEKFGMTAAIQEGDDVQTAIEQLKAMVNANLEVSEHDKEDEEEQRSTSSRGKKSKGKKYKAKEDDEEDFEEESDDSDDEEDDEEDDSDLDEYDEEEEEDEPKKKSSKKATKKAASKKAPAKKKGGRSKASTYDRKNDLHKNLVGEMIAEEKGEKWKSKANLVKAAVKASANMNGEDFLDGDAVILDSFREEFMSYFKKEK